VDDASKPFFFQALDALKLGDRRGAAVFLARQLHEGNTAQKNLPSVAQLAAHIGEIDLAIEASRRWNAGSLESLLGCWAIMGTYGRAREVLGEIEQLPISAQEHPSVLHVRGTIATQFGRFEEARALYRRMLARAPGSLQTWFSLAMVKRFTRGDPDLAVMTRLEKTAASAPPDARSALYYGIGKALEDVGDVDAAFDAYSRGAAIRRAQEPFDTQAYAAAAEQVIRDFTPSNLAKFAPSDFEGRRSLFVTGLPRSGTTLTEQMLVSHSAVSDGAELNLFETALMPLLGNSYAKAARYSQSDKTDPWGEIARDYAHLLDVHFGSSDLVVDKSLAQAPTIGLMLHSMPEARIAWLRRSPEDVALSCFKTYFTTGLKWTCSLTDIADYMRAEDRLFDHWRSVFPDRILVVPYEELVAAPAAWSERLQRHFELPFEPGLEKTSRSGRSIRTASVGQVSEPISTSRIGGSAAFERHLQPFRDRYYG
jgi:tetratricopeptide (TPR) repeat protein